MPTYNSELPLDAAEIFVIRRDTGIPPGSEKATWHKQAMQPPGSSIPNEMVRNVVIHTLTMFKPTAGTANGTTLIVAPGGAFHFLMMYHAGYDVARWLIKFGVTAFVLKYRVPTYARERCRYACLP
jgi:acetyl esterase/lipase